MDEGRWVNAMVLMFPILRARDAATKFDKAAIIEVVKKVLPSVPSSKLNLVVK